MKDKSILITGASSGFGAAIARRFAGHCRHIIITGRRAERLEAMCAELKSDFCEMHPLCFDVRDRVECQNAVDQLPQGLKIDILVNNAGLAAGLDTIDTANPDDWDRMIDTNIKGLLYMSHAVLPLMPKGAHIINIGSTAGKEVYHKGNVYCATKHAVDAITKGMRIDLLPRGIKVSSISPGAARTEFSLVRFGGDAEKAKAAYNGYEPMRAEDIAEVCFFMAGVRPGLCLNDVVMTSAAQANSFYINRGE